MNLFKFGRGDFLGIIIPGAFLLANTIYLFIPEISNKESNTAFYSLMIIVSYIVGISLRLLSPDWLECFPPQFKKHWGEFPYINWYLDTHLNGLPNSFGNFFKSLLKNEFNGDRSRISQAKGKDFINYCKTEICLKSDSLHEGILHAEGFSRLISGMGYALAFCALLALLKLIIISVFQPAVNPLSYLVLVGIYSALCLFFKGHLRRGRAKEALMVLEAYALLNMEVENNTFFNKANSTDTKSHAAD